MLFQWLKIIHLISLISWMAGLLYLPRLFVYHTMVDVYSDQYKLYCVMEYKLYKYIMNPALLFTWIFGLLLAYELNYMNQNWFYIKLFFVSILTISHYYMSIFINHFSNGKNNKSTKFYRILNEVPTLLMVIIVIIVVLKPFS